MNKYWTKEDVDFSHCNRRVQLALLATLEPCLIMCANLQSIDIQEYLLELRKVINKAIEIGDAVNKEAQ